MVVHKAVSESELIEYLNSELEKHGECNDCRFKHIRKDSEADEQGCNWALPMLHCSGIPALFCKPTAEKIIFEARKLFSLK